MRYIVICRLPASTILLHICLINGTIFGKRSYWTWNVCFDFLYNCRCKPTTYIYIYIYKIKVQLDATVCCLIYFTAESLYMFRVSQHPSSGVLKTLTAASGTGHNIGTATSLQHGQILATKKLKQISTSCNHHNVMAKRQTYILKNINSKLEKESWSDHVEGKSSCTDIMTCTAGCGYSFQYSWWWVRWTPETCRVNLQ